MLNFVAVGQKVYTSTAMEIRLKTWTCLVSAFKVTQGRRKWHGSIGYF